MLHLHTGVLVFFFSFFSFSSAPYPGAIPFPSPAEFSGRRPFFNQGVMVFLCFPAVSEICTRLAAPSFFRLATAPMFNLPCAFWKNKRICAALGLQTRRHSQAQAINFFIFQEWNPVCACEWSRGWVIPRTRSCLRVWMKQRVGNSKMQSCLCSRMSQGSGAYFEILFNFRPGFYLRLAFCFFFLIIFCFLICANNFKLIEICKTNNIHVQNWNFWQNKWFCAISCWIVMFCWVAAAFSGFSRGIKKEGGLLFFFRALYWYRRATWVVYSSVCRSF